MQKYKALHLLILILVLCGIWYILPDALARLALELQNSGNLKSPVQTGYLDDANKPGIKDAESDKVDITVVQATQEISTPNAPTTKPAFEKGTLTEPAVSLEPVISSGPAAVSTVEPAGSPGPTPAETAATKPSPRPDPTPTPKPSPRPTPKPTPTVGTSPTQTPAPKPTQTATPEPKPTQTATPAPKPSTYFLSEVEQSIFAAVNQQRKKNGLQELTWCASAYKVASTKAKEMYVENYFAHKSPVSGTVEQQFKAFGNLVLGQNIMAYGENIAMAKGYDKEKLAEIWMEKWLASDGHRQNILNEKFTHMAVGVYYGEDGRAYAAQEFYTAK